MSEAPEGVYEGRASRYKGGRAEITLENAMLDAYDQGMAHKEPRFDDESKPIPYEFEVVKIFLEGTNPPSDYKVRIRDNPHG